MASTSVTALHRFAGWVGAAYLRLVAATSVVEIIDDPAFPILRRRRRPIIYAFWHSHQVFLAEAHRETGVSVMVSRSKDGEYIAQVMARQGLNAVRGSSSKGGDAALREMLDLLERGRDVAFTPDGPKGPVKTVHGGVLVAARLSGAPVVPVAVSARRKIVFRSWDRLFLPLPFNHITVVHGRPIRLLEGEADERAKSRVRAAIDRAVDQADAFQRDAPAWISSAAGVLFRWLYTCLVTAFSPFLLLALAGTYGRRRAGRHLGERFQAPRPAPREGFRLWLHVAGLGEWQALKPLLARLKARPDLNLFVTTTGSRVRQIVAEAEPNLEVRLAPVDHPWILAHWLKRAAPDALALVESEMWPNLVVMLHRRWVPVFIVNGRMSVRSAARYRPVRPLLRSLLRPLSGAFVRTVEDGRRFHDYGVRIERIDVTGNTKCDNLAVLYGEEGRLAERRALFGPQEGVFIVGGSTWPGEEEMLLRLSSNRSPERVRLILAPRELERVSEVQRALNGRPVSWTLWSKAKDAGVWDTDVLVVDTLGDLARLYRAADLAFVGGSLFPRGGQNPLEPAAAGLPLVFGPHMFNFSDEATALRRAGAARAASSDDEAVSELSEIASNASLRAEMGKAAARCVEGLQGASERTVEGLLGRLGL